MLTRINRLVLALLIVGIASYIFVLNPNPVTVNMGGGEVITAPLALILISTFILGLVFCTLFAIFLGAKAYWRERQFKEKERRREQIHQAMLRARSLLAAGEWSKSREEWRNLVQRNPEDIIARVEYSRALQGDGDLREALKVLDAARTADPTNVEVLFQAAELNLKLGNKTAAVDNLALILYHQPNIRAAIMARNLSEELGRIDDALEYQLLLSKLGAVEENGHEIHERIKLRKVERDFAEDRERLMAELSKLVKGSHPYHASLVRLAELEQELGNIDEAVKLLLRASKLSGDPTYWNRAAALWLTQNQPSRAIAVGKSATLESTPGRDRIRSELELARLYLSLNMNDEARSVLNSAERGLEAPAIKADQELARAFLILRGQCFYALGEHRESSKIWQQLSESKFNQHAKSAEPAIATGNAAPSPTLSTP